MGVFFYIDMTVVDEMDGHMVAGFSLDEPDPHPAPATEISPTDASTEAPADAADAPTIPLPPLRTLTLDEGGRRIRATGLDILAEVAGYDL